MRPHPRTTSPTAATILLVAMALVVVAGCANGSRELREPPPGATAPLRSTSSTLAAVAPSSLPAGFLLTSPVFQPGEPLPTAHTCFGAGDEIPLAWYGVPEGTAELAVVVTDRTAGGTVQWVVAGIAPTEVGLTPGALPPGAVETQTSSGVVGWEPPCPPEGEERSYDITLYALSVPTGLQPGATADDALAVLDAQSTSRTILTATVDAG